MRGIYGRLARRLQAFQGTSEMRLGVFAGLFQL
jgi:hypothetical protein